MFGHSLFSSHRRCHYLSFQLDCRPLTPREVVPENPSKVPKGPDMCLLGSPGCPQGSQEAPQGPLRAWGRGPRPGPCCPRPAQAQNGEVAGGWRVSSLGGAALPRGSTSGLQASTCFRIAHPSHHHHPSSSPYNTIRTKKPCLACCCLCISSLPNPSSFSSHSPISGVE